MKHSMNHSRTLRLFFGAILVLGFSSGAFAQATRTWVSGVGDDANPCSRTAPCKTFAGAISKTATGGEISVLDPGGFGTLTITKSITVNGDGTLAGVLSAGAPTGFTVNITTNLTSDVVIIRNVSINGVGTGTDGVRVLDGHEVILDNVTISGLTDAGVDVAQTQNSHVALRNVRISKCTGDGIRLTTSSGLLETTIENCTVTSTANGLHVRGNARAVARECVFSSNTANGVFADSPTAGQFAVARVWESQISFNNSNGVQSGTGSGSSIVEIAQNQINNNAGNGVLVSANGTVQSFANNSILGNGVDTCPSCTPVGPGN